MTAFIIFISLLFAIRLIRWLAIIQQKEYRLDRISSFLTSKEGQAELIKLFPSLQDLTPSGFKRPQVTLRGILVGILTIYVATPTFFVVFTLLKLPLVAILILIHLLTPLITIIANLPTSLVYTLATNYLLGKAIHKIKKSRPIIIGITGSYAKTSTRHLLAHMLSQQFSVYTPPKSFNNPLSIAQSINHHYKNQKILILEYAAYKQGEIKRLAHWFPPQVGIITGISSQHLSLFGSLSKLIKAKSELIHALLPKTPLFCNGTDPQLVKMCQNRKFTDYSNIKLTSPKLNPKGQLSFTWNKSKITTKLIGQHYLYNIKACISVSQHFKLTNHQITTSLKTFTPKSNFIKSNTLKSGALLLDDSGTSNLKGFEAAIKLAHNTKRKQNILIFGGIIDLGKQSVSIHADLAKKAKYIFTKVIYTGIEGKSQFKSVFKTNLVANQKDIVALISQTNKHTLILLEGFIPKHLKEQIKS